MPQKLHRIYMKRPTCHPIMKIWTLGWHYMREMQQQWDIKEMLEMCRHRPGYQLCLYCDCITSGPAVLISLDALRNSESNEMCSWPFCC